MAGGPKKHLKRIATPKRWCLAKLDGIYAPRPRSGPHKLRECIPLALLLRNKLKYALTYDEVKLIAMQRLVKIDHKVRTDKKFPVGFMDVVQLEKTGENFRMLYDTKGRFEIHKISKEEAAYKLCRVRKTEVGHHGIPYAYLHDGRTIRYAHPSVKANDTLKIDLATGKPIDRFPFKIGALAMATSGRSAGRIGRVESHHPHPGSVDVVSLRDSRGDVFTTKMENVFIIGTDTTAAVTLPKGKGIKKTILEEQQERFGMPVPVPTPAAEVESD